MPMLFNGIKANLKFSLPILLTRLLGIGSNLIVMILMARLGTTALSASALIMGIFSVCVLLVMAFSFSVCALIAEACGRQNHSLVGEIFRSSILLNTLFAIPFLIIFYNIGFILEILHQPHPVAALVGQYFYGMMFGYLPIIWASILEQFFIGVGKPRYIVYLSIFSLFVTPLLSSILIFGQYGFPALGMLGAGLAVSGSSFFSLLFLISLLMIKKWHLKYYLFTLTEKLNYSLLNKLYQLGWPIALQFCGEFLAYTLMTIMMGWVGIIALAAQQIILQFTSVVVMIPTSVSQATAVLVGQARGKKDGELIKQQVNSSIFIVTTMMMMVAFLYLCFPETLANIYLDSNNNEKTSVLALTKVLLMITAISQCFDGIRNVLAGAYRGIQETKTPMLLGTASLWLLSLPLAYFLGFNLHGGAEGIRLGFTIGIIFATLSLSFIWYGKTQPRFSKNISLLQNENGY